MGRSIACFPACGKTYYVLENCQRISCVDHDFYDWERHFRDKWLMPYMSRNKQLQSMFDIVFINALPEILAASWSDTIVIYPHRSLKEEWSCRSQRRNYESNFYMTLEEKWDEWIDACEAWQGKKFVLGKGEYLQAAEETGLFKNPHTLTVN